MPRDPDLEPTPFWTAMFYIIVPLFLGLPGLIVSILQLTAWILMWISWLPSKITEEEYEEKMRQRFKKKHGFYPPRDY